MDLPFLSGPLPAAFRRRTVVVDPGGSRPYDSDEWHDELVVVEHGRLDLECRGGGVRSFPTGAVVCLDHLGLRTLHNRGSDPTVLVAVSRRPDHLRRIMEPRIVELPERPYLGIRRTCTPTTMNVVADRIPAIIGHLLAGGGAVAGAPFLRYRVLDGSGSMEVDACVPSGDLGLADGEIEAGSLPVGRYAVVLHRGHPDGLLEVTDRLLRWAERDGHAWDMTVTDGAEHWAARTEHFLTDPREQPDLDRWESELAFRLAD
ncbi:GyrI-like domain-containing protein [Pseudonocardia abyssalis]|uniref:GyrI-like domain-containing protein n=1 Tax=Pseudonocardia abyssalis TaxID=2792008 RepID=A0ABS6UPS9_9PSEU|nr:GyrI-like domain-containing protein [Pseudonocardia abyssalis]MBW0118145.1 GyrI-like domain-containing protein [Pseudonocardia abyssalis]MBW0134220.1 GyrI-like domain-containing protein [Pseudonocardia abyssalis]